MSTEAVTQGQSYGRVVWKQFKKNKPALFSLLGIVLLGILALSADLLAGDKPYYMKYKGETYFPAFRQYAVYLGVADWPAELKRRRNFKKLKLEEAIFPPVPYAPGEIRLWEKYQPPGAEHWLGTDRLGRDVLSGLIHGTRYALTIGLVAVGISLAIGLVLGALAGYFGGWVDLALSRLFELWAAIPSFFLILTGRGVFPAESVLCHDHYRPYELGRYRPLDALAVFAGAQLRLRGRRAQPRILKRADHVPPHPAQRHRPDPDPGGLRGRRCHPRRVGIELFRDRGSRQK